MQKKYQVAQGVPAQLLENYLNDATPEGYELSTVMVIHQEDDLNKYIQAAEGKIIPMNGEEEEVQPNVQVIPFAYPIFKKEK